MLTEPESAVNQSQRTINIGSKFTHNLVSTPDQQPQKPQAEPCAYSDF